MADEDSFLEEEGTSDLEQHLANLAIVGEVDQFLHCVVDDICGRDMGLQSSGIQGEVGPVAAAYTKLIRDVIKKNQGGALDKQELTEKLGQAKVPADLIPKVVEGIVARRPEIEYQLKTEASQLFPSHLRDFDWSIRLVVSSGQISEMREPVLILTLRLKEANRDGLKDVNIELSKSDLDKLLKNCDDIHQVIQSLKV